MSIRVFAIVTLRHGSRGKHITPCFMFPRTSLFIIVLGDEEEDKFVDVLFVVVHFAIVLKWRSTRTIEGGIFPVITLLVVDPYDCVLFCSVYRDTTLTIRKKPNKRKVSF